MTRPALAAPLLLVLAACDQAPPESDDPPTARAGDAVAQASAAAAGERPAAFAQCSVCHTTEPGQHLVGPSLAGVYGARAGAAAGYPYSNALKQARITWDERSLDRYLEAPMAAVPGTRMTYAGLKDPGARRELVAYLKTL